MRRTPLTEFTDARSAAIEARKAMLERVGLRQSEVEPEPNVGVPIDFAEVATALTQVGPAVARMAASVQRAMEQIRDFNTAVADRRSTYEHLIEAARRVDQGQWTYVSTPQTGLMPDAYRGGQRASVHAMYDPITWPDEGYPCQLCWAVKRWPWEPMRSCPVTVDVESTYCEKHGGKAKKAPKAGAEPTFVAWDETTANLSSPNWNGLANVVAVVGAATGRFRLVDITEA